mgnify:CR=1 FL=1
MATTLPPGLVPLGDLDRPVPAGAAFARLDPAAAKGSAPRPRAEDNWTLEQDGTLKATVLGLVEETDSGLRVRPLWTLSPDRMTLGVDLHPLDFAGQPLTPQQVALALAGKFGSIALDTKALLTALEQVRQAGAALPGWVAARGTPPVPGENSRLELFFDRTKSSGLLREDGTMDYRERGGFQQVAPGSVIAVLHPPTRHAPGVDVLGNPVAAADGKALAVKIGENVQARRLDNGALEYLATIEGTPEVDHAGLRVSETVVVTGDVDLDSGNVVSERGSVEVRGSVRAGFAVTAGKNVEIKGLVEAADITAGGDVLVQGGIIMAGENTIRAGGGVGAKFLQNALVRAGGDVATRGDITQCDILCRGAVAVNNGHGSVTGGVVRCRTGLLAKELGGDTGVSTRIEILVEGPRTPELSVRQEALQEHLAKLARGIGSEDALSVLMSAPEEDRRILAELIKLKSQDQTELKAVEQELAEDSALGEKDLAEVAIQATGTVYPGVEIRMGRRSLNIVSPLPAATFRWNPARREIETG